jgi:hypothetical protein
MTHIPTPTIQGGGIIPIFHGQTIRTLVTNGETTTAIRDRLTPVLNKTSESQPKKPSMEELLQQMQQQMQQRMQQQSSNCSNKAAA